MPRRFVIVGRKALASADFILDDLPGTSGRLDVLVRCLRAALLSSHGLRAGVIVYLVLLGGPRAPRVVRVDAAGVRFFRPDERSLAVLMKKVLATHGDEGTDEFVIARPGVSVARGGFARVLADAPDARMVVFEEGAPDLRGAAALDGDDLLLAIGDHLGLPDEVREHPGAERLSVGPVSIHADDVVAIVTNELDRRA